MSLHPFERLRTSPRLYPPALVSPWAPLEETAGVRRISVTDRASPVAPFQRCHRHRGSGPRGGGSLLPSKQTMKSNSGMNALQRFRSLSPGPFTPEDECSRFVDIQLLPCRSDVGLGRHQIAGHIPATRVALIRPDRAPISSALSNVSQGTFSTTHASDESAQMRCNSERFRGTIGCGSAVSIVSRASRWPPPSTI